MERQLPEFLTDCDCVSVVQLYSGEHLGRMEKKMTALIRKYTDIPVVAGHTLFADLNAIRRGAGALLNARLIPTIHEFMQAVGGVFREMGLPLPTVIIRSDGSQMSTDFALQKPVETLLCGPAASAIGAFALTGEKDALIVDMGGTTTDIALIKNGRIRRSEEGIQVGDWRTFVKGLYVDTFGLGGDTAIHYEFDGRVYLEKYRMIPLCILAERYPVILEELRELDHAEKKHPCPLHEYLCLQKEPADVSRYTEKERKLIGRLRERPLSLPQPAEILDSDIYTMDMEGLEKEGVIIRAGLTPTDIMHLQGDYMPGCREASSCAARFMAHSSALKHTGVLCEYVYHLVTKRLYENLVRILLQTQCSDLAGKKPDEQLQKLINYSYYMEWNQIRKDIWNKSRLAGYMPSHMADTENTLFRTLFSTKAVLIGVGAPIHVFLPRVARLLHTKAVIPEYAGVANAVGAIAGQIYTYVDVTIRPVREENTFEVLSETEKKYFPDYESAFAWADRQGEQEVIHKLRRQGASEKNIQVTMEIIEKSGEMRYGTVWFVDILRFHGDGVFQM